MDIKELETLIQFHKDGLAQYRQFISPAAQYLEEQTIKALEELRKNIIPHKYVHLRKEDGTLVNDPFCEACKNEKSR